MIVDRSKSDSVEKAVMTMLTTKSTKKRKGQEEKQPDYSVSPASSFKVLKKTAENPVPNFYDQNQYSELTNSSGQKPSPNHWADRFLGKLNATALNFDKEE